MKSKREQGIPHQGYMGHLFNIAHAIIRSAKVHSAIFYLLEDIPNRGWKKFETKFKAMNKLRETPFTGYPPPTKIERRTNGFQFSAND